MDHRSKFTFKISTFPKWGNCQCFRKVALVGWRQRLGVAAAPCGVSMWGADSSFPGLLLIICALCSVPWFSQQSEHAPSHPPSFFCYLLISMFLKAVWSCFGLSSAVTRLSGQSAAGLTSVLTLAHGILSSTHSCPQQVCGASPSHGSTQGCSFKI